jgi:hypothetical protein
MSGPFKMKNSGLAYSAKHKSPFEYGSPNKKAGAPTAEGDEQNKKTKNTEKKSDFEKVGDDAMKYHQEQAKAQGLSWPEYKKNLEKRMKGY